MKEILDKILEFLNQKWVKIAGIALAALLLVGLGFYLGRKREPDVIIKEKTEYVELPPIHDTIDRPVPYKVKVPADTADIIRACIRDGLYSELFPEKVLTDTVYISKEDTTAILRDWATERFYAETLFDSDTLGKFSFDAMVKYNRLANFNYTFVPIQKQTEVVTRSVRTFLPYIGVGLTLNDMYMAQGGLFFKQDYGLGVQYIYDHKTNTTSYGAMFMYMF